MDGQLPPDSVRAFTNKIFYANKWHECSFPKQLTREINVYNTSIYSFKIPIGAVRRFTRQFHAIAGDNQREHTDYCYKTKHCKHNSLHAYYMQESCQKNSFFTMQKILKIAENHTVFKQKNEIFATQLSRGF
jgi:hypothetical protein